MREIGGGVTNALWVRNELTVSGTMLLLLLFLLNSVLEDREIGLISRPGLRISLLEHTWKT